MNTRRLFLVGLSLLVLSALSFLTFALLPLRSSASVPVGNFFSSIPVGGPGSMAEAALSDLVIEKDWPAQMDLNTSDTVEIVLTLNNGGNLLPTATSGNHRIAQAAPIPVGTPDASIEEAFGRGYEAFATANLVATTFDVKPLGPQEQRLNQTALEWSWNMSSKSLGTQIVNADIEVQWKPLQTNSPIPVILTQLWQTRIEIRVTEPLLDVGLSVSTQVVGFIGAFGGIGLTVPWVWERLAELVRKKKMSTGQEGLQATEVTSGKEEEGVKLHESNVPSIYPETRVQP